MILYKPFDLTKNEDVVFYNKICSIQNMENNILNMEKIISEKDKEIDRLSSELSKLKNIDIPKSKKSDHINA